MPAVVPVHNVTTSNFHLFASLVLVVVPSRATTFVADTSGTLCAGDLVEPGRSTHITLWQHVRYNAGLNDQNVRSRHHHWLRLHHHHRLLNHRLSHHWSSHHWLSHHRLHHRLLHHRLLHHRLSHHRLSHHRLSHHRLSHHRLSHHRLSCHWLSHHRLSHHRLSHHWLLLWIPHILLLTWILWVHLSFK